MGSGYAFNILRYDSGRHAIKTPMEPHSHLMFRKLEENPVTNKGVRTVSRCEIRSAVGSIVFPLRGEGNGLRWDTNLPIRERIMMKLRIRPKATGFSEEPRKQEFKFIMRWHTRVARVNFIFESPVRFFSPEIFFCHINKY